MEYILIDANANLSGKYKVIPLYTPAQLPR